jgi:hypothetical protein
MCKKVALLVALVISLLFSCENENDARDNEFTVIVESKSDFACGLPLIRFLGDQSRVQERTRMEVMTYNAYHLDNSLNIVGAKLIIEFEEVAHEDMRFCTTLGIGYPAVSIVKARMAN